MLEEARGRLYAFSGIGRLFTCWGILTEVAATGKALLVQEAPRTAGFVAEIAARIAESDTFHTLKAPLVRLCGLDVPMAYAPELEKASVPQIPDIVGAARQLAKAGTA